MKRQLLVDVANFPLNQAPVNCHALSSLFARVQNHVVTLPNMACDKCYLRLQRQASEWAADYVFRSCADVTLVQQSSYKGAKTVNFLHAYTLLLLYLLSDVTVQSTIFGLTCKKYAYIYRTAC